MGTRREINIALYALYSDLLHDAWSRGFRPSDGANGVTHLELVCGMSRCH